MDGNNYWYINVKKLAGCGITQKGKLLREKRRGKVGGTRVPTVYVANVLIIYKIKVHDINGRCGFIITCTCGS